MEEPIKEWIKFTPEVQKADFVGTVLALLQLATGLVKRSEIINIFTKSRRVKELQKQLKEEIDNKNRLQTDNDKIKQEKDVLFGKLRATNEEKNGLQITLDELIKPLPEPIYKRFEDINKSIITYGPIDYPPLLHFKKGAQGIGIALLNEIFSQKKLEPSIDFKNAKSWDWQHFKQIFYGDHTIDLIATPLFETRSRSKSALFCSPVFFSEVGIYVKHKKDSYNDLYDFLMQKLKEKKKNDSQAYKDIQKEDALIFNHAIELIQEFSVERSRNIKVKCIKGEISEKLVDERLESVSDIKPIDTIVSELLNTVLKGESDIVCMEVYQAENSKYFNDVVNILAPKELLYPVSFAVRKEEYILKNFINLKLLEIGRDRILEIIIKELIERGDTVGERLITLDPPARIKEVEKYFIFKK